MKRKWDVRGPFRLRKRLREWKPEILHSFCSTRTCWGGSWGGGREFPCDRGVRVCEARRHHLLWDRFTQGAMDAETCVCEAVRLYTEREAGIDGRKLVTIPNGVELPALEGLDRGRPEALFVGRIDAQKDVGTLLAAWPLVRKRIPAARLRIVGQGPQEAGLRELGVEGVDWCGFQADVAPYFRTSRVLVLRAGGRGCPTSYWSDVVGPSGGRHGRRRVCGTGP